MAPPGVVVHYSNRLALARHPSLVPPRTRIDETAVDLALSMPNVDDALGMLSRAVGRRLTTVARLREVLVARPRCRWRRELLASLDDIGAGCHSLLELRYLREVERAHGLPPGNRQSVTARRGKRIYRDVRYDEHCVVVELDGAVAHPVERRGRDLDRDNAEALAGGIVLHYGWRAVTVTPCDVASEVVSALTVRGWLGTVRRCSVTCRVRGGDGMNREGLSP